MTYPSPSDYVAAVQRPRTFLRAELARAVFVVDPLLQIPMPASGNSAVVFKVTADQRPHAFRFFIRDDVSSRERYRSLRAYVDSHGLNDVTAAAEWVDDAVVVNDQRLPMVRMEWVEGQSLDSWVDHLVSTGSQTGLARLAQAWADLVERLQRAGFAHGDLQHGNVLVDAHGRLRLVDFDGSWVDGVRWPPPNESGHPNYQLGRRTWGRWMDTFPGLLVHTSLLALACRPDLWRRYSGRENLLFVRADLVPPFRTPVWSDLAALRHPGVDRGLAQLRGACGGSGLSVPLQSLLDGPDERLTPAPRLSAPRWAPAPTSQPRRHPEPAWTAPPAAPPPPGPPLVPTTPLPRPPRPPRRVGWWIGGGAAALVVLLTLVGLGASGSPGTSPTPSESTSIYVPPSPPETPSESPTPTPDPALVSLFLHVPSQVSDSCTLTDSGDPAATAALRCRDSSLRVDYVQFDTVADMDDAFSDRYRQTGEPDCADDVPGTGSWSHGHFSCYVNSDDDREVSWTYESYAILTVATGDGATFAELLDASDSLTPTS